MSDYLDNLRRKSAERREKFNAERAERAKPLEEKITDWFDALPGSEQCRRYKIKEISDWLGVAPSLLGPVLFKLGWTRKRGWKISQPLAHYWLPPRID